MKQLLLAVVLSVLMVGAVSATNVAHTMVGGVIVTKITGATTTTPSIEYNVPFPSLALCESAVAKVEQAFFSPTVAVTQGLTSPGDARKLVFLQCVARAAVTQ